MIVHWGWQLFCLVTFKADSHRLDVLNSECALQLPIESRMNKSGDCSSECANVSWIAGG